MLERIDSARAWVIKIIEGWLPEGMSTEIGVAISVTAVATLFLIFFLRAVRYVFDLFTMKVGALEGTRLRPLRFQNEVLLSTRDIIGFAARLLHWLGTAGAGGGVGTKWAELQGIVRFTSGRKRPTTRGVPSRMGFCLRTC